MAKTKRKFSYMIMPLWSQRISFLQEDVSLDECFVSNVLLEYLRSLYKQKQPVDSYFLELVVQTLCDAGQMGKLQQLVTYRVGFLEL